MCYIHSSRRTSNWSLCVTGQDGAAELVLSWSVPSLARKQSCISQMSFIMRDKICIHLQVRPLMRFTFLVYKSQWNDELSSSQYISSSATDLPNVKCKVHSKAPSCFPLSSLIHLGYGTYCHPQSHEKCGTGVWPKRAAAELGCCQRVCVFEECSTCLKSSLEK